MARVAPLSPPNKSFFIFDCTQENYKGYFSQSLFISFLAAARCPCCYIVGGFSFHGTYEKYLYEQKIRIQRVRCRKCRITHAIIPEFSVPGRSCGSYQVDELYRASLTGSTRGATGKPFVIRGMGDEYPKQIVSSQSVYLQRMRAVLVEAELDCDRLVTPTGCARVSMSVLNRLSLAFGYNAVICSRINILSYQKKREGMGISHNMPPTDEINHILNSS